jgi:small subunit ribosomal protein S16
MLMIRMQRTGRTNDPAFRIVALEKTSSPKAGKYTDLLGTYNPKTKALTIAADRVKDWMGKGAQLSPSLSNLLINKKVIEGKKVNVLPKKTRIVSEAPPASEAPAAEAPAEVPAEEAPIEVPETPVETPETPAETPPAENSAEAAA